MKKLSKIIIPKEHLSPVLRSRLTDKINLIRKIIGFGTSLQIPLITHVAYESPGLATYLGTYGLYTKYRATESYNKFINYIRDLANKFGLLDTKVEHLYPKDWIKPTEVAKTHPIFYIDLNGNLVILQNSRLEYYRYAYQKSFPGKFGLQPWLWRSYFEPPQAPESVKQWTRNKLRLITLKERTNAAMVGVHEQELNGNFRHKKRTFEPIRPK
jgi:hypothetical protein